jgi:hypothetical protein
MKKGALSIFRVESTLVLRKHPPFAISLIRRSEHKRMLQSGLGERFV